MPAPVLTLDDDRAAACHWAHIDGDRRRSATPSAVWICDHPYPSMRAHGPSDDCAGCPVWDAMARARAAAGGPGTLTEPIESIDSRGDALLLSVVRS